MNAIEIPARTGFPDFEEPLASSSLSPARLYIRRGLIGLFHDPESHMIGLVQTPPSDKPMSARS
jgi:hypothetical protein